MIQKSILFVNLITLIIVVFNYLSLRQLEYLVVKSKRRLEEMPSKSDLEAKIAELAGVVDAGFTALGDTLTAEIQQVKDAIAAAGDTSSAIAALDTLEANMKAKFDATSTSISDVVTPAP